MSNPATAAAAVIRSAQGAVLAMPHAASMKPAAVTITSTSTTVHTGPRAPGTAAGASHR